MLRLVVGLAAFAVLVGIGGCDRALAQNSRNDPASHMTTPGTPGGSLNANDLEKFRAVGDRKSFQALARARTESGRLVSALNLACEVTAAEEVGHGESKVGGKSVDVAVYEVACGNGMGYLLESNGVQGPIAMSCFAADATRAADRAHGESSEMYCQLPANRDVKGAAASLMSAGGTPCAVDQLRWFGLGASGQIEYSEVVCSDGKGYILKTPRTRPSIQPAVLSCQEAAARGLKCHLTDGGPVTASVTAQTFRDALRQNGVECEPADIRVIGRESVDRRYVVEVQCPQHAAGLVAFIPLNGNTNPFEIVDCAAAVDRGVVCQLATK